MSKRFRPAQRLHSPREYAAVFAARQVLRSTCFDLLRGGVNGESSVPAGAETPSARSQPRLGLVIPKRLARRAVLRNTIKRQAREAFRHHHETLPTFDLVLRLARWPREMTLLATPEAIKRSVRQEIELLLDKLRSRTAVREK